MEFVLFRANTVVFWAAIAEFGGNTGVFRQIQWYMGPKTVIFWANSKYILLLEISGTTEDPSLADHPGRQARADHFSHLATSA